MRKTNQSRAGWMYVLVIAAIFGLIFFKFGDEEAQIADELKQGGERVGIAESMTPKQTETGALDEQSQTSDHSNCRHCASCAQQSLLVSENKKERATILLTDEMQQLLLSHKKGAPITFELPRGITARGVVKTTTIKDGRKIGVSGILTAPQKGRFFFDEQSMPGLAGQFSGVVHFVESDVAYAVEPNASGQPELREKHAGNVICRSYSEVPDDGGKAMLEADGEVQFALADHPTPSTIPNYQNGVIPLESLPGALAVVYLDYDGEEGPFPGWGDFDAAPAGVSNAQIRDIWEKVAEDFAPFNINVTTDLAVFLAAAENSRMHCIITPTKDAEPSAVGVAYVGDFNRTGRRVCWSFVTSGASAADVISHEVGHTLGLSHDGKTGQVYYPGHGSGVTRWTAIMGYPGASVSQWSKGEYYDATQTQDDLSIIANNNNNVGQRVDDHSESYGSASYLEVQLDNSVENQGVIETAADFDSFRFTTTATGDVTLTASVGNGANLDILAEIVSSDGSTVIASGNPADSLSATVTQTSLPAGDYMFRVSGAAFGDPSNSSPTGYTAYGSLGYYTVSGTVPNTVHPARFTVAENSANETSVGTVLPRNSHGVDPIAFAITSGNSSGAFDIDASSGEVTVADSAQLDYETLSSYFDDPATFELFVDITNATTPSLNETVRVVVEVTNVNEAPVISSAPATFTYLERLPEGTVLWQAEATDVDNYDYSTFSISAGNADGNFTIDSETGVVSPSAGADVSGSTTYNLTVTVTDEGGLTDDVALTITLIDYDSQYSAGAIALEYFDGISGASVSDLTSDARFPANSDVIEHASAFSFIDHGADYGSLMRGYVIAPFTGNYTFWVASNDNSELYLSTDDSVANRALVASVTGVTNVNQWDKYSSQQSVQVSLTAGQVYYIEARHKDSGGGADHLQVAWQGPGITQQVIDSIYLAPFYVNRAPVLEDEFVHLQISANNDHAFAQVRAADINVGETVGNYTILSGNTNNSFAIDAVTGVISVADSSGLVEDSVVNLQVQGTDSGSPAQNGTATIMVKVRNYIVSTGFESIDGFTGYTTSGGGSSLGTTTDRLGTLWSNAAGARIANDPEDAANGEQYLVLGWSSRPSSVVVDIPGSGHGLGEVTLRYASFSSSSDCDLTMSYRVNGGAWQQAWTTSITGYNPDYRENTWAEASAFINQAGDVDLKLEVSGDNGGVFIDDVTALSYVDQTAPTVYWAESESIITGSMFSGMSAIGASDNSYELLSEVAADGTSKLVHQWNFETFDTGSATHFEIEAYHNGSSEGDNFIFSYSTDGTNFTDFHTLTKTSDNNAVESIALPTHLIGKIYIRARDADRTAGNTALNWLIIDYMRIVVSPKEVAPVVPDSTVNISEDTVTSTTIHTVPFFDRNGNDTHTVMITEGNSSGVFSIDNSGNITTLAALDYDVTSQYVLTVEVTDNTSRSATGTVTINVEETVGAPVAQNDSLVVNADAASIAGMVLSNDEINSPNSGSVLGFLRSSVVYDAGDSGSPEDPASVAGGSWTEVETEDGNVATGDATGLPSVNHNSSGLDAWIVTDNTAAGGDWVQYQKAPSAADRALGDANGWLFETEMRFIDDYGTSGSIQLEYGNGSTRFLVFFELDDNGALIAKLLGTGSENLKITADGAGTTDFHTISILYDPSSSTAAFLVDGVRYDSGAWEGQSNGANGVEWGGESSGGKGSAAFNRVEWSVFDTTSTLPSGASFQLTGNDVVFHTNGGYDSLDDGQSANESIVYYLGNGTGLFGFGTLDVTINGVDDLPAFDSDPVVALGGTIFETYSDSLANYGGDPDDTSTFSKIGGPAWLNIASDGSLTGIPTAADTGLNRFTVQLSDGKGNDVQAMLEITVASSTTLISDDFEGYDVENPSDFSVSSVASGNWTSSDNSINATRIFDTTNFGTSRLWISNVSGASITSKGVTVGGHANYSLSVVMVAETGGDVTISGSYDLLIGQTAATATSVIGGAQIVDVRGDDTGAGTQGSKADHVFTRNFQTSAVNPGDKLFVRFTRVSGSAWFGVDDVQLNLVGVDDGDTDKLADAWEMTYYPNLTTVDENSDTDGDGLTAFQEMVFGTDPTAANATEDVLTQSIVDDAGTDKLEVKFRRPLNHGNLNVTYQLQSSTTLGNGVAPGDWASDATIQTSVTPDADGVTGWVSYRFTLSAHSKCFVRMVVTPNP